MGRFVSIWFRHLATDWFTIRQPLLRDLPLVLRSSVHGRMVITAANIHAKTYGISEGMVLADARAILPDVQVRDDQPDLLERLLRKLAEWCIRFTPHASVDLPDGLILDATGCSHLWGGDEEYVDAIQYRLEERGYDVVVAMADTVGAAWATARYGRGQKVIPPGEHHNTLLSLPPESMRLDVETVVRLRQLGLITIKQLIELPRQSLRRRFGIPLLTRIDQAFGAIEEHIEPVLPVEPYMVRLPCMDPIVTATGIEMALEELLKNLCGILQSDQKGIRAVTFKCFRVDGKCETISIDTSRPSHSVKHLFTLFQTRISRIEPAMGIELFVLEATLVDDHVPQQQDFWARTSGLEDPKLSELVDRISGRLGRKSVTRFMPDEHYWPERSIKPALSLTEEAPSWKVDRPRPLRLLTDPIPIDVAAPIPDYPPMLFRHNTVVHNIIKADGPERIEQEWWLQQGQHRDYYAVEDEAGKRYWIFRLGHYDDKKFQWFLHGFFA